MGPRNGPKGVILAAWAGLSKGPLLHQPKLRNPQRPRPSFWLQPTRKTGQQSAAAEVQTALVGRKEVEGRRVIPVNWHLWI